MLQTAQRGLHSQPSAPLHFSADIFRLQSFSSATLCIHLSHSAWLLPSQ